MPFTYEYQMPYVTVDCLIFNLQSAKEILLIRRKNPPFKNEWALPGGFIDMNETLKESAIRELNEETGISGIELHQLDTYGDPGRDPRGRVVSIIFWGIIKNINQVKAGDDAKEAEWFSLDDLPGLAFDHKKIIIAAKENIALLNQ